MQRPKFKTTKWEIFIWMGTVIVLVFVVLFAAYSYRGVEKEMAAQFNREQGLLAQQTAMGIQQYMSDITNIMNLTSRIKSVSSGNRDEIILALKNAYLALNDKVVFVFWEDSKGIMRYHYPEKVLPGIDGKDYSFRTYFRVVKEMRVPFVSDIILVGGEKYKDIPGRFATFIIAFPLNGEDNRFKGIIGCAIDLTNITAHYVAPIKPSGSGYAWLVDESGMLLYHPNPQMITKNIYEIITNLEKKGVKLTGTQDLARAMELKNDGMYEIIFPHYPTNLMSKKLVAFSSVHFLNRRWVTVVTSPYSEVIYLMSGTFKNTLILGSVSIFFVIGATLFMLKINKARTKADERNKWADEVLSANKRLETIFNGVPHFLAMIDTSLLIKDVNQMYCDLYGKDRQELVGRHCIKDFPDNEPFCNETLSNECFSSAMVKTEREVHLNIKDKPYIFDISLIPVLDRTGYVDHIIQYGVDVTEKKALTEKLIQAEKLAAVGQISAHMAHEIRNPLASILLNSELLEDEIVEGKQDTQEALSLVKIIKGEIDRLSQVTEEYLSYARLPLPKKQMFDPALEVEAVKAILLPEIRRHNIGFSIKDQTKELRIFMDKGQFRQLLINLIKNAMDAMPSGGDIEILLMEINNSFILMAKDTGFGIPMEIRRRIFDPYFTTKENGTGLGLALVQYIINAHDGWIEVESQKGSGTTFIISIPLEPAKCERA